MSDISMQDSAVQHRKFAKTCVEKKRRDRINKCLDELKNLMSQSDDKARFQKLEKAEILEMAVVYMKNQCKARNPPSNDHLIGAYKQCFTDFQQYLCEINIDQDYKQSLIENLNNRFTNVLRQRYQEQSSFTEQSSFIHNTDDSSSSSTYSSTCSSPVSSTPSSSFNLSHDSSKPWRPW